MNHVQIESLLERYWEGDTTIVEERQLKTYFQTGPVDERFSEVAPLFLSLSLEQQILAPAKVSPIVVPRPTLKVTHFGLWRKVAAAAVLTGVVAVAAWYMTKSTAGDHPEVVTSPAKLAPDAAPTPTQSSREDVVDIKPLMKSNINTAPAKRKKTNVTRPESIPMIQNVDPITPPLEDAYSEAEARAALEEVKAALVLVSRKMNKGKSDAAKPLKKMNIVDHYFKNS